MITDLFKSVTFTSLEEMKKIPPDNSTIVISILDLDEELRFKRPNLEGFKDSLTLSFEDTFEECKLKSENDWPDEPSDFEHSIFCQSKNEKVPALSDAVKIINFIRKHRNQDLTLIVHCFGGISRSAAVASWISTKFWVPLNTDKSLENANPRVLRLLDKANNL